MVDWNTVQMSSDRTGKVDTSPMLNTSGKSMGSKNKSSLKRVNPDQNNDSHLVNDLSNPVCSLESPFRTPPSLSYCHDKVDYILTCELAVLGC